jgi:cytochrome c oxidase cbb3-type subunit 3
MSEQHDYDGIKYREEKQSPGIFRILLTVLIVWGVAFMGYFLFFSGWSSKNEADTAIKLKASKKQIVTGTTDPQHTDEHKVAVYVAAGKQMFGKLCASCHGEEAKGSVGPDLTKPKYKYGDKYADISKSITEGRPGGMPAFGSQIDHEQTEGLVQFLISIKPQKRTIKGAINKLRKQGE